MQNQEDRCEEINPSTQLRCGVGKVPQHRNESKPLSDISEASDFVNLAGRVAPNLLQGSQPFPIDWGQGRSKGRHPVAPQVRFLGFLTPEPNTGCLLWTGALRDRTKRYGAFQLAPGRKVYAHRFAWESANGLVPDGLTVDHLCCQPSCCEPRHMQLVTQAENSSLAGQRLTHCWRGHLRNPETHEKRSRGRWRCLPCRYIEVRLRAEAVTEAEAIEAARSDWPELFAAAERRIAGIMNKRVRR
jgi:hypothetical protein